MRKFWNHLSEADRLVILTREKFAFIRSQTDLELIELSRIQREALARIRGDMARKQLGN